jgi:hypothetical protein
MVIGRRHCEGYFGTEICEIVTERASLPWSRSANYYVLRDYGRLKGRSVMPISDLLQSSKEFTPSFGVN